MSRGYAWLGNKYCVPAQTTPLTVEAVRILNEMSPAPSVWNKNTPDTPPGLPHQPTRAARPARTLRRQSPMARRCPGLAFSPRPSIYFHGATQTTLPTREGERGSKGRHQPSWALIWPPIGRNSGPGDLQRAVPAVRATCKPIPPSYQWLVQGSGGCLGGLPRVRPRMTASPGRKVRSVEASCDGMSFPNRGCCGCRF